MNTAQRIIKYFAIAFAVLIIGGIISAMITGVMLLSYINTQLRDYYPSLTEFCRSFHISEEEIRN